MFIFFLIINIYSENVPVKGGSKTKIIKETTYTTDYGPGGKTVQRELFYDSPDSNGRSRPRQRSPEQTFYKTIEKNVTTTRDGSYPCNDTGLYGGINRTTPRLDRTVSPPQSDKYTSGNTSKVYNYSSSSKTEDIVPSKVPYNEIVRVETTQGSLPPELQDLSTLSEDILPKPSTKVTTTVRTYTYEIPAEPAVTTNKTIVYKNEYDNRTTNTLPPHHVINQTSPTNETYIYKSEQNTTNTIDYPGGQVTRPRPTSPVVQHPGHQQPPVTNKTIIYKTDTRETTRNVYPKNQDYPIVEYPPDTLPHQPRSPPPSNTTIIYKENITDRNTNIHHPPPHGGVSVYPPPATGSSPPQPGPKTTYYYKHESTNTKNTHFGPPGSASPYPNDKYPKNTSPSPIIQYPNEQPSSPNWGTPPQNTTINYKYSTNTNSSTRNAYPEKEPLLQPTAFPTDGYGPDYPDGQNPPKKLDDLMATFGDVCFILYIFYELYFFY